MKLKHIYNDIHEFYRVISNHPAIKLIESIYMYMLRSNKKKNPVLAMHRWLEPLYVYVAGLRRTIKPTSS